jgi:hypothetical protein
MVKRRRRRTRRRGRRRTVLAEAGTTALVRSAPRKPRGSKSIGSLTIGGRQFLQSVLAPYDFAQVGCGGLPDEFSGPSFTVVQRQLVNITQIAGKDYYLMIAPTPQSMYWSNAQNDGVALTGDSVFNAHKFADLSVFSESNTSPQVVDNARVIGMTLEIKCVSPKLTAAGSISVARGEVRVETRSRPQAITTLGGTVGSTLSVVGPVSLANGITSAANFTGPVAGGCFAVARHVGPWTFSPGLEASSGGGAVAIPDVGTSGEGISDGQLVYPTSSGQTFDWFDNNMETLMVRISAGASNNTLAAFTFEVMMVVECRPALNTAFAKIAAPSPPEDRLAMEMYERLVQNMPIAVPAAANANWWRNILAIAKTAGYVIGHFPGPVGAIGRGVEAVSQGFEELFI